MTKQRLADPTSTHRFGRPLLIAPLNGASRMKGVMNAAVAKCPADSSKPAHRTGQLQNDEEAQRPVGDDPGRLRKPKKSESRPRR